MGEDQRSKGQGFWLSLGEIATPQRLTRRLINLGWVALVGEPSGSRLNYRLVSLGWLAQRLQTDLQVG